MKTKQFIRLVEKLGYVVHQFKKDVLVYEPMTSHGRASISKEREMTLSINTDFYVLAKLCVEYAETPIEEREEEKKYIVILPDPEQNSLLVRALCKDTTNRVTIGFDNELIVKKQGSFRLTEAEIKRNHEYLWQFAKEVEMEGKDNE